MSDDLDAKLRALATRKRGDRAKPYPDSQWLEVAREAAALALEDAADLLYRKSYTSNPWSLKEACELVRARAEEIRGGK